MKRFAAGYVLGFATLGAISLGAIGTAYAHALMGNLDDEDPNLDPITP